MLSAGRTNLIDHLESMIDGPQRARRLKHFSTQSPLGLTMDIMCLDRLSWKLVSFFVAQIGDCTDAKLLEVPKCATSKHRCCPNPGLSEKYQLNPLCETLSNNPGILLLVLGVLYAAKLPQELLRGYYGIVDYFVIFSCLSELEKRIPTVCKLARAVKKNIDKGFEGWTENFWPWNHNLRYRIEALWADGYVVEP
jgi:hypothetical protein